MRGRQLIIESLMRETPEEEKWAATLLDDVFGEIESDIKSNKDALAPQQQNEGVGLAILGGVVAAPALMKIIGKGVKLGQNAIRKKKGDEPLDSNAIIKMGEKLHNMLIGGVEKALFFVGDKKKRHRLAVIIFHAIIVGLLIGSGKALFKALAKHQTIASFFEAMLTAIKSGELGVFIVESFGELATALGTGAELADAADLAAVASDAAEVTSDITEVSTMAAGDVAGASGGLGKRAKVYDIWNQKSLEETNMNKLKITKGRLRQIIFEEVQRAKGLVEGGMSSADPSDTDAAEAKERAAQEPSSAEDPFYTENLDEDDALTRNIDRWSEEGRDIPRERTAAKMRDVATEDWEAHFKGGAEDDWSQIHKLEKDAHWDREEREKEDHWHSDEHETLGDRKYAERLREKVRGALEEMLSAEPVAEAKDAKKDYDGDGKVESSTEEWKGSRDKAIKKAEDK